MGLLDGKTAIVTGGAQGIGFAIAKRFHDEGAKVVVCDIAEDKLSEVSSKIPSHDGHVLAVRADVTVEGDIKQVVRETVEKFRRIDILVNNAGIVSVGRLDRTDPSVWEAIMGTNTYAPWRFMVAVLPEMRKAGGGSIINISSINGIKAFPGDGIYCTSKAGLQMLSQVMATEVASDNVRVNLILPGFVEDTGFPVPIAGQENLTACYDLMRSVHPLGRNAKPGDIANTALFLASDQSAYITGVLLNVDGGRHLAMNSPVLK
ncbi:MAG: glucose 1-dehydrogenase [Proteobacteria bacterium]|nr:glucose 1-dehydrogenase [Pseudomonadota bacterium]